MNDDKSAVIEALAPSGRLRVAINYGNIVLAQRGEDGEPAGVSAALARALARAQAAWLRRELPARRAFEEDQMLAPIISAEARLNAESLKPQQLLNAAGEQVRRADGTAVSHGAYRTFFDCDAFVVLTSVKRKCNR